MLCGQLEVSYFQGKSSDVHITITHISLLAYLDMPIHLLSNNITNKQIHARGKFMVGAWLLGLGAHLKAGMLIWTVGQAHPWCSSTETSGYRPCLRGIFFTSYTNVIIQMSWHSFLGNGVAITSETTQTHAQWLWTRLHEGRTASLELRTVYMMAKIISHGPGPDCTRRWTKTEQKSHWKTKVLAFPDYSDIGEKSHPTCKTAGHISKANPTYTYTTLGESTQLLCEMNCHASLLCVSGYYVACCLYKSKTGASDDRLHLINSLCYSCCIWQMADLWCLDIWLLVLGLFCISSSGENKPFHKTHLRQATVLNRTRFNSALQHKISILESNGI